MVGAEDPVMVIDLSDVWEPVGLRLAVQEHWVQHEVVKLPSFLFHSVSGGSPEGEAVKSSKTYPFLKNYPGKIWKGVIQLEPLVGEFKEFSEEIFYRIDQETNPKEEKEFKYDLPNGE